MSKKPITRRVEMPANDRIKPAKINKSPQISKPEKTKRGLNGRN